MPSLSDRVVTAFASLGTPDEWPLEQILALYAPDIHFIDPFHDLHGHEDFARMMRRLTSRVSMRFEELSVVGEDFHFCMSWKMFMRLKLGGPEVPVPGITEFRSRDGALVFQRDAWDTLGPFLELVPGAGPLYRQAAQALFG
jgi:steroid delta-isomerase